MSQYPQPQWNPYAPPPRRGKGPVIVVLLVLGAIGSLFLIGFVGLVIFIASMNGQWDAAEYTSDLESSEPPHPHDWAAVRAAYNVDRPPVDADTLARLQPLLDEFVRASNEEDQNGLRRIIDSSRFFRQMKASRFAADIALYDQPMLQSHLVENVTGLPGWERIVIVAVTDADQRGEKIIYAHGFHSDHYSNPVRLWVADNRRPQLFDWELLEYGIRESGDWAIFCAYDEDPRRDEQIAGANEMQRAEQLWDEGETAAAKAAMHAAMQKRTPPPDHDEYLLGAAYTWLQWRETEEIHAAVNRMKNVEHVPGAIFLQAQAYFLDGDYEECLASVEKFESIMGTTPESLDQKARACDRLKRYDQAKQHYANVAKILRDDPIALENWARALDEEEHHLLAAHLQKLDNTMEVATSMAARSSYDADLVAMLTEVISQSAPNSPTAIFLKAVALQSEGDYAEAVPLFQTVLTESKDETQLETARWRYMDCVIESDQAVEAYQTADDPQFIYDYLVEDYEYDGTVIPYEDLVTIVDTQLKRFPDDPWNYYYASVIKEEGDETLGAMQTLVREGLKQARTAEDEAAEAALKRRLVQLLYRDGKAMVAYRTIRPANETFKQLGELYHYGNRPLEELKALIDARAEDHLQDPWLAYYLAVMMQKDGKHWQADLALAQLFDTPTVQDDEQTLQAYRFLRLELLTALEKYHEAYSWVTPATETFDYLARHLHDKQLWQPLEKLLTLHQTNEPDDPQGVFWRVQMLWTRAQYAAVAAAMQNADEKLEQLEAYEKSSLQMYHVRSLLRTNHIDAARKLAERLQENYDLLLPMILVHVTAGEVEPAGELIAEYAEEIYNRNVIYQDEDIGELLRGPAFAEVRRAVPADLPYSYAQASCVLLLEQPQTVTSDQAQQVAATLFGDDVKVTAIPAAEGHQAGGYLLMHNEDRAVIVLGNDRYQTDVDLRGEGVKDKSLRDAHDRHQGWIAVELLEMQNASQATPQLLQATATLMDDKVLLVNTPAGWLLPGGEVSKERLASGDEQALPGDEEVWLYRTAEIDDAQRQWIRVREKQLRQLDKRLASRTDSQQFHIQVTLSAGDAREAIWLRIDRADDSGPYSDQYVAQFEKPPLLLPNSQPGDYVAVNEYRIDNWKMTDGDQTTFAHHPSTTE